MIDTRLSGRLHLARAVVFVAFVAACGRDREERGHSELSAPPVPVGVARSALRTTSQISDYAVYASNSVSLMDRAVVNGGDVGVQLASAGPFLEPTYQLGLRSDARVEVTHDILASRVLLKDRATVGDVEASSLTNQFGVYAHLNALPSMPALPSAATPAPGSVAISVANGQTQTKPAGAYGSVNVQGTLNLSGGTYELSTLTLGDDAKLEALGSTVIHVAGRVSTADRARIEVGPSSGLSASGLRLEVSGQNGSTGALSDSPKAIALGNDTVVRALVLAPNGTLQTGQRTSATGALVGRDVLVNLDARITYENGFSTSGTCGSCDDNNPCTADACSGGTCTHSSAPNGTSCGDGNSCTQGDSCQAGACIGSNPVSCTAQDQCHVAGTCDPATGACSNPTKANGTTCSDGSACTQSDTCQGGSCVGSNPVTCTEQDPCHAAGSCDPATGACSNPTKTDGTACSDGSACTQTDICQAGACVGANPVTCTAQDQCHGVGSCNPATGGCTNPAKVDGTACSDGSACTQSDSCQAGACVGTSAVTCLAQDQCHAAGTCDPGTGACSNPAKADGSTCSDGSACTQSDTCQAGTCVGSNPVTCTAQNQCHAAGTCDPATGACSNPAKADGTTCSDGSACTQSDTCQAGACVGASPVACAAQAECHVAGTCDPATGACSNATKPDGSACSDGNVCTQSDTCQAGACVGSNPVTCAAQDQCHVAGTCDPSTGACSNPTAPPTTACGADGSACSGQSHCDGAGACVAGAPLECPNDNPCVVAACDDATGCMTIPRDSGAPCGSDDGNVCNGRLACDGAGHCVSTPSAAAGTSCGPGMCGAQTCDGHGVCVTATSGVVVDDQDECTLDSCSDEVGVQNVRIPGCGTPATVAPIDQSVPTDFARSISFLYSGDSPVQQGVDPATISATHAAVIRGRVLGPEAETGTSNVLVTILGHPEYGFTFTRADGYYDLAVNGGGVFTVSFRHSGYLPVQRTTTSPWREFVVLDDVVLTGRDENANPVVLGASEFQVARGSVTTTAADPDGQRRGTLLIPPGLQTSSLSPANGTLTLRATEYTIGEKGPLAMPGTLPPQSGYTYAVELSVDEADAAGVGSVTFDRDVYFYVENFLDVPVVGPVPSGYYDGEKGRWIPSTSGRVIRILSNAGGIAHLDVTGDGVEDTGATLTALGLTDDERVTLATTYPTAPQSLWRIPLRHFTGWDFNWGFGPPADAVYPPPSPAPGTPVDDPCSQANASTIECQNQILGEDLPIAGTPWSLNYSSDRTPGRRELVRVRLTDNRPLPASLRRIVYEVEVAGRFYRYSRTTLSADLVAGWTWDRIDAYGRVVQGPRMANIRVGYVYGGVTQKTDSFAGGGIGDLITGDRTTREVTLWTYFERAVGSYDAAGIGLGGWNISPVHVYDRTAEVLYRGDGSRESGFPKPVMHTLATMPETFGIIYDILPLPNGDLLVSDGGAHKVYRVTRDGAISVFAGGGSARGDGGPATSAVLVPRGLGLGPDGSVYIADTAAPDSIRRVDPNGMISTVVGNGIGPALFDPYSVDVSADGTVYFVDTGHCLIRKIGGDGTFPIVAGTGSCFSGTDNVPATSSPMGQNVLGLKLDGAGGFYYLDASSHELRHVETNGIVKTIAGRGESREDGVPATTADFNGVNALGLARDGELLVNDGGRIRRVDTATGLINTLAGVRGSVGYQGDNGPARAAILSDLTYAIAVNQDGEILLGDNYGRGRVRQIASSMPGYTPLPMSVAASRSSNEIYSFDAQGRHVESRELLRGAVRAQISYDANGLVSGIRDGDGNLTQIERPSSSTIRIVAPHGQVTTLGVDQNGRLASVTNPAFETTWLSHAADGLLTELRDPRGNIRQYEYFRGFLERDVDAVPGSPGLSMGRFEDTNGWTVNYISAEGRTRTYRVDRPIPTTSSPDLYERRTNVAQDGTTSIDERLANGNQRVVDATGTTTVVQLAPDPRFGMAKSYPATSVTTTPSGKTLEVDQSHAATLSDPANPLSMTAATDETWLNGDSSKKFRSVWNASSATITTTTPVGRSVVQSLDSKSRVTRVQVPGLLPVDTHYDVEGRVDSVTQGTRTASAQYGVGGFVTSTTDVLGRVTLFPNRDGVGRVRTAILPGDRTVVFEHNANGDVSAITPPGKPAHQFSYTPRDLVSVYAPPDAQGASGNTSYTYDFDRDLLRLGAPSSPVTLTYDTAGRPFNIHHEYASTTLTYDGAGRLASAATADGAGALSWSYDGQLLTRIETSGGFLGSHAVDFTHDNFFRVTNRTVDGTTPISRGYDADGSLNSLGAMTITRSPTNGLLASTSLGVVTDSYAYNGFGEVTDYTASVSGTPVFVVHYDRDAAGRIHKKQETTDGAAHTSRYEYDEAGRLWQVYLDQPDSSTSPDRSYEYDANGNRLSDGVAEATYDAQDRLLTHGDDSYAYTADGALATKTSGGSSTTSYRYDVMGNLRHAVPPAPAMPIDYLVDAQNRRIGSIVNGSITQALIYGSGGRALADLSPNGNLRNVFGYGTRSTTPDLLQRNGAAYRVITDHLGSPRLVINASTGEIAQRMTYDEWGTVIDDSAPGFQPFGFAGGGWDRDTGLVRFGARDYHPTTGRWTSKDASRFAGGLNFYGYTHDDPVNYIDIDGHHPVVAAIVVVAFVIGYSALLASDDAAIQAQTHPEMHNNPVLGIVGSVGMIAPLGGVAGMCGAGTALSSGAGPASRVLHASRLGELGSQEGTVVLGHYSRPLMGGIQETLPTLENAASQLGGRTLSSLPPSMSVIAPQLSSASRIVFYTSTNMHGLTAAEMALIQSEPALLAKTTFVYGGF